MASRTRRLALVPVSLLLGALSGCATTFDPDRLTPTPDTVVMDTASSPTGPVQVTRASGDPWDGWADGLYQAWRIEREDGTPLTQWLRHLRINSLASNSYTPVLFLPNGKVLVFDTAEGLSNHDTTARTPAWYLCTPTATERLPYYHIRLIDGGGALAFLAEWEGKDPAAPKHGASRVLDPSSLLGWRTQAHDSLRRLQIVRLDDDCQPVGPPVAVNPRAEEGLGWRGDMLWALTLDRGYTLFDARMQPVELELATDVRAGHENVLHHIDAQGAYRWWSSTGRQGAIPGPFTRREVGNSHGMPRVLLGSADTPLRTLVHLRHGVPVVVCTDVVDLDFATLDVPEYLRGREPYGPQLVAALVRRDVGGQQVTEVFAIDTFLGHEPMRGADRAAAEALLAQHLATQAEQLRARDAEEAATIAAEDDRRLKLARARLAHARQWAALYRKAFADGEFDLAERAVATIDELTDVPEWPRDPSLRERIQAERMNLWVVRIDWAMHRPGASIETLLPEVRQADFLGVSESYWLRMKELVMARVEPLAAATYQTLYHNGFHRMGEDGKARLQWLYQESQRADAKADYDRLMAAGNYAAAGAIAYRLGEDGWIEHLITCPEVSGREALLRIAAERRPTGAIHERIQARLDGTVIERQRQQRAELQAWATAADREARGQQATNQQRSANYAEALRLARQGYEVSPR